MFSAGYNLAMVMLLLSHNINNNLFTDNGAVCWYHDFGINWYRVVLMSHQTLSLGKYWKLFSNCWNFTPYIQHLRNVGLAVGAGFSQDSVSGRPVTNKAPSNSILGALKHLRCIFHDFQWINSLMRLDCKSARSMFYLFSSEKWPSTGWPDGHLVKTWVGVFWLVA